MIRLTGLCAVLQSTPNSVFKEFLTSGLSVSAANVCTNPIGANPLQQLPWRSLLPPDDGTRDKSCLELYLCVHYCVLNVRVMFWTFLAVVGLAG